MSPAVRTRGYLHLFRSSPIIASGTAIAKWTPDAVEQIHHAEFRSATIVLFRTASHAKYPKACPRDVVAVLKVQDYRVDMVRFDRDVRIYLTPREGIAHFYVKPTRRSFEKWRFGLARVLANPVPSISEFRVCGAIGSGGMGRLFVAEWCGIFSRVSGDFEDPLVFLKVLPKGGKIGESINESAAVEREVLAKLHGLRYLEQLSFAFQTTDNLFLGTPFCPGGDLRSYLRTITGSRVALQPSGCICPPPKIDWLDESTVRTTIAQIVVALGGIHSKGIAHCDLRLSNVLIGPEGHIFVSGFDNARFVDDEFGDAENFGCGPHIAPEVGREKVTTAADIWSLGVVAFELLTGQRPFPKQRRIGWACDAQKKLYSLCMPCWLSQDAKSLILSLLHDDVSRRPSLDKIRSMDFFATVDWSAVEEGRWTGPFPQVGSVASEGLGVEVKFEGNSVDPGDVAEQVLGFEYNIPGQKAKPLHVIRRLHPAGLLNLFRSFPPEDRPLLKSLPPAVKSFLSIW